MLYLVVQLSPTTIKTEIFHSNETKSTAINNAIVPKAI